MSNYPIPKKVLKKRWRGGWVQTVDGELIDRVIGLQGDSEFEVVDDGGGPSMSTDEVQVPWVIVVRRRREKHEI